MAYTISQLEALWVEAGGPSSVAPIAAAIAATESGFGTNLVNSNDPGGSYGLWQINGAAWGSQPWFNAQQLVSDPLANAEAAVKVYNAQGFGAWSTFTNGTYKANLPSGASAPSSSSATTSSNAPVVPFNLSAQASSYIIVALGVGLLLIAAAAYV